MIALIKQNKLALFFLARFVVLYFVLNTLYGFYIEWYSPGADPITNWVSRQTGLILSVFYQGISVATMPDSKYITLMMNGQVVVSVFEGCNGLNVTIVFLVFLIAYNVRWFRYWFFILSSIGLIYVINLMRVTALFLVSLYFPDKLYLYHKFFFTGIIYSVVFFLWFKWIRKSNSIERRTSAT